MSAPTADVDAEELRSHSLGDLLSRLGNDSSLLVRQEIELARVEMTEKAVAAGAGAAMLVVALVVLLGAYGAGITAAIAGFANLVPVWAAALIVLGILGLFGGVLVLVGLKRLKAATPLVPERAVQTAKETPRELVK